MKSVIVAPVGDNVDALFIGLKELNVEKVVLIATKRLGRKAESMIKDLSKFKIPAEIADVENYNWEEVFRVVGEIKAREGNDIIINIATGDSISRCATTCAAFVNGIKAFDVVNEEVMMLPVLKFSYYRLIPERKMTIIKYLYQNQDCCASLDDLSKRLKMSLPLVSYHINGTLKSEGLQKMGLVETKEGKRRTELALTTLAKMLIKGYVEPIKEN